MFRWRFAVIACVLLVAGCSNWSESKIRASQARGDEIIAALERYKQDHGLYPGTIEELVPQYLSVIRSPTAGTRIWHYSRRNGGSAFMLGFDDDSSSRFAIYNSISNEWNVKRS